MGSYRAVNGGPARWRRVPRSGNLEEMNHSERWG
jgi:hypothetical protein